jgi:transcriptional regulator with XRE-family HTH domain
MITVAQVKAARKLLGWSQMTLALETGLASTTIGSLERGNKGPSDVTLAAIQRAFENAGVEFPDGGSAQLKVRDKNAIS